MTHKVWMIQAAYFIGIFALLTLPFRTESWLIWAALSVVMYVFLALVMSVGNHRLFSHGSFKTSKFWRTFLMYASVFIGYGSPIQWAVMHQDHHAHSDTDADPNPKYGCWSIFWNLEYSDEKWCAARIRRLISDPSQVFLHRHYTRFLLSGFVLLLLAVPTFFLNVFLPGLGLIHLVSRLHLFLAHHNNGARDLAFLEFLVPAGGEWYHKQHHETPRSWRFGRWDLSAVVVAAIRKK